MLFTTRTLVWLLFISQIIISISCSQDLTADLDNLNESIELTSHELGIEAEQLQTSILPPLPVTTASSKTEKESDKKEGEHRNLPMMNVPSYEQYKLPKNGTPLFSKPCLVSKNPSKCSSEILKDWLTNRLRSNTLYFKKGEFNIQFVTFEIDKKGTIKNVQLNREEGNVACEQCSEIAIKTVKGMPKWVPAMQNGEPIVSTIKLPIKFMAI